MVTADVKGALVTDDDDHCRHMPTRLCFGICNVTGYCYRFPWQDVTDDDDSGVLDC